VDPEAVGFDEGRRFPLCHPDRLRALFESADLYATPPRQSDGSIALQARAWTIRGHVPDRASRG
jgi:hypothetical protein